MAMKRSRGGQIAIAIAGCHTLDPSTVAMHVLLGEQETDGWGGLARLPLGAAVLLRSPLSGSPGPVEQIVASLCSALSIPVDWRLPTPGMGGAGTIERDRLMVEDADAVITYVDPQRTDEGGTVRVQRMGLVEGKPSWSFAPLSAGRGVTYVGSATRESWTSA